LEWEEGDDDIGEDVEDDAKNQEEEEMEDDEEGDPSKYNYQDGFCVADDVYLSIDENMDEETKMLYKKKLQNSQGGDNQKPDMAVANTVCIIAPSVGGRPWEKGGDFVSIEGFGEEEAVNLLASHTGERILEVNLWLDAFPPALVDDADAAKDSPAPNGSSGKYEYSLDDLRLFARFAHHCTLNSKEKLVEELRNKHPSVFSSRAKATRKLDSIAVKNRQKGTSVYWEVKREILVELGLDDVLVSFLSFLSMQVTLHIYLIILFFVCRH
jgi:hypothetical protein